MRFLILLPLALALVAACGGIAISPNNDGGGAAIGGECHWPANMNPPDAGFGWTIGHHYLQCDLNGTDELTFCVTDNATCTDSPWDGGLSCVDQCAAGEYAVEALIGRWPDGDGGFVTHPGPPVPRTCRNAFPIPGGELYCCPCDTSVVDADAGASQRQR